MKKIRIPSRLRELAWSILAVHWLAWLTRSDARFEPYLAVAAAAVYCHLKSRNADRSPTAYQQVCVVAASVLFSSLVMMANYRIIQYAAFPFLTAVLSGLSGFLIAYDILGYLVWISEDCHGSPAPRAARPWAVFAVSMAVIAAGYLLVFFQRYYPGTLSPDSLNQIRQISTGVYRNHHPFYHTMIIRGCMALGRLFSGDINVQVAVYSVFQILFMASVFAYIIVTLYQAKVPVWCLVLLLIWYAAYPVHVIYSFTMWKDVIWGGMVALFSTALVRVLFGIGKRRWLSVSMLAIGAMGFCLLRSNGWFAFALAVIVFALLFAKKYPRLLILLVGVLACSWVLKGPVLKYLNVPQPDTIESLSIPAQQVAKVFASGKEVPEQERNLLSNIVDVDLIAETYSEYISDPIKALVRKTNNLDYLNTHKLEFLKLWVKLGLMHPDSYFKAWVQQTRGYWNGGYGYWEYTETITKNDYGIFQREPNPAFREQWSKHLDMFSEKTAFPLFLLFRSIGFQTWLLAGVFVVSLAKKRWKQLFLTVPLLAIILSLMVATPVFSEFRYAYAVFASLPVVLCSVLYQPSPESAPV